MATENEQIIIDVVPDLDTRKFVQEYIEFGKDLKKLAKTVEGFLTQELKVNIKDLDEDQLADLQKQVTAVSNKIIAEAKRMEREDSARRKKEKAERLKDAKEVAEYEIATGIEIGKANIKRIRQRVDAEASARKITEKAEADYFHRVHVVLAKRRQKLDDDRLLNLVKDKDAEAKMLLAFNKERTAEELALFRQQLNTKHTYRRAEIAKIRADRKAEDAWFAEQDKLRAKQESSIFKQAPSNKVSMGKAGEYQYFGMPSVAELQKAKTELAEYTAKTKYAIGSIKEAYKEAKASINVQGTLLDQKKISDDNLRNVKAYKKAYTTGIFAWTPDEQQALDKFWKIKREQEVKEAISTGKSTSKAQTAASVSARIEAESLAKQKAPIGAMGVQVASSGAFSSLATKQTYNSASDFKSNVSMENTARAAMAQSAKLGKQAAHEFNNSFLGSFMSGTSFGHKVGTTMQYMLAGAGIAGGAMAFAGLKDAIVEADKYMHMFMGVLEMSEGQAKTLQASIFDVGKEIGGTAQGMSEAALMLGRAGIANDKLAGGLKVAAMAANIAGDSIENITEMLAAWATVYPGEDLDHLGDVMAKVANESLLSIDGLKTATSYITASGAAAGITADSLIAMAGAWKMTGKADSIVGTEMRRFFMMIEGGSEDARKAYWALGIDLDKVNKGLKGTAAESKAAMLDMFSKIKNATPAQLKALESVKAGMNVLEKQTVNSSLVAAKAYGTMITAADNAEGSLKTASDKIALSYEKMWERIVFAGKEGATKFEQSFKNAFVGAGSTTEEFDAKIEKLSSNFTEFTGGMGTALGELTGIFVDAIPYATKLLEIFLGYKLLTASAAAISAIAVELGIATTATRTLTTALLANPLFWGATAIVGATAVVQEFRNEIDKTNRSLGSTTGSKNFLKDLETIGKATTQDAQIAVAMDLRDKAYKKHVDLVKKYNEENESFRWTNDQKNTYLRDLEAKRQEFKALDEHVKRLQAAAKSKGTTTTKVDTSAVGPYTPKDDKGAKDAQRKAQDALDIELARIRKTFEAEETKHKKLGTFNERVQKDLKLQEETQLRIATEKAKGVDDHTKKVLKAQEAELKAEGEVYELANKSNKEAAKKASITLADNRILQATNEYAKASAELSKAKLEAELAYNEELEKGTSESKAKALQEEAIAKATVEYQNKILELDKKRAQERIKLQQDTSSMLEENKAQQQAITDEYRKFLGYGERALELEQLKASVAKETRSIYREQEAALSSKYAGDKDVDTSAQVITDDGVIQKLSAINDKELQRLALMEYQAEFQKAFASGLDEQAINLDGILAKYQAIADKISNLELKVDIEIAKDGFDSLSKVPEYIKDWVNSQGEAEGQLGRIQKALKGYTAFSEKSAKNEAKNKAKLQDLDQQLMTGDIKRKDYLKEKDKIATEGLFDQMNAYGALAGVMASAFEQGSEGAIAFTAIQSALGIASSWTAIAEAWALGFPQNIPAVATVTAAVMPIISQLGGSGGSSGGGGGYGSFSKTEMIEKEYNPMIDRLDKQIELLESIDKKGSAGLLSVGKGRFEYERDLRILIEDSFKNVSKGGTLRKNVKASDAMVINDLLEGFDPYKIKTKESGGFSLGGLASYVVSPMTMGAGYSNPNSKMYGAMNRDVIRDMSNFLEFASVATSNLALFQGKKDSQKEISKATFITNVQEVISDFALSMGDVISDLSDAKDTFKESFDEITGTLFYASKDLSDAYETVNATIGNTDLPTYLQDQIDAIVLIENKYGTSIESMLLNTTDFAEQSKILNELNEELGTTFNAGTKEALDFIDSIELVSESMATSVENIKTWNDSFKDNEGLVLDMANTLGVAIANSRKELDALFNSMSLGIGGLTDQELDFLEANKDLLQAREDALKEANDKAIDAEKDKIDIRLKSLQDEKNALQKLIDASKALYKTAEDIRNTVNTGSSVTRGTYRQMYQTIKDAMAAGLDYSQYTSDFDKYADQYAADIKKDATSREEYIAKTIILANEIEDLAGRGAQEGSLWAIESAIKSLENTLSTLGADMIKSINRSGNSKTTSTGSIGAIGGSGSYVGSGNIPTVYDITTGKEASFDSAYGVSISELISQIQKDMTSGGKTSTEIDAWSRGLSAINNMVSKYGITDIGALASALTDEINKGILGSGFTYDAMSANYANLAIQQALSNMGVFKGTYTPPTIIEPPIVVPDPIAPPIVAPDPIEPPVSPIPTPEPDITTPNRFQSVIEALSNAGDFGNRLQASDISKIGISTSELKEITAINKAMGNGSYINPDELPSLLDKLKGYSSGGYTGNMSANSIAGVVHGKEYVVNAQTTRDLGLNNSAGVFAELLDEIKSLRVLTTTVAASSVKSLSTQRAMLGEMTA